MIYFGYECFVGWLECKQFLPFYLVLLHSIFSNIMQKLLSVLSFHLCFCCLFFEISSKSIIDNTNVFKCFLFFASSFTVSGVKLNLDLWSILCYFLYIIRSWALILFFHICMCNFAYIIYWKGMFSAMYVLASLPKISWL